MTPDNSGQIIQVLKTLVRVDISVGLLEKKFQPIIAPTMAWDVETGTPNFVIAYTAKAAESAVINAPGKADIAPSFPSVWDVPAPDTIAPRTTNIEQIIAAVRQLTIFVPTAVPKTFPASLAPSAQPKNRPLVRNIKTRGSNNFTSTVLWHIWPAGLPHLLPDLRCHRCGQRTL